MNLVTGIFLISTLFFSSTGGHIPTPIDVPTVTVEPVDSENFEGFVISNEKVEPQENQLEQGKISPSGKFNDLIFIKHFID